MQCLSSDWKQYIHRICLKTHFCNRKEAVILPVTFQSIKDTQDELIKYAVIAARYNNKWVFCRHRERSTWEIPGGHREPGEAIIDTARRELYEETGALSSEIKPVCIYRVNDYGLLCYAEITQLGSLPESSEIAEIQLFDTPPRELTYPFIQPDLFRYVQGWINTQNSPDEIWDTYDEYRRPTGRTHRRGDELPAGEYHVVVHAWIENSQGEFLLTKRAPNKGYPNMRECTGGSALAGDDSLTSAVREIKEETGLDVLPEDGRLVMTQRRRDCFDDIWLFHKDFSLDEIVFQPGETCDAMAATRKDILRMRDEGTLVPMRYLNDFFKKI